MCIFRQFMKYFCSRIQGPQPEQKRIKTQTKADRTGTEKKRFLGPNRKKYKNDGPRIPDSHYVMSI